MANEDIITALKVGRKILDELEEEKEKQKKQEKEMLKLLRK